MSSRTAILQLLNWANPRKGLDEMKGKPFGKVVISNRDIEQVCEYALQLLDTIKKIRNDVCINQCKKTHCKLCKSLSEYDK